MNKYILTYSTDAFQVINRYNCWPQTLLILMQYIFASGPLLHPAGNIYQHVCPQVFQTWILKYLMSGSCWWLTGTGGIWTPHRPVCCSYCDQLLLCGVALQRPHRSERVSSLLRLPFIDSADLITGSTRQAAPSPGPAMDPQTKINPLALISLVWSDMQGEMQTTSSGCNSWKVNNESGYCVSESFISGWRVWLIK